MSRFDSENLKKYEAYGGHYTTWEDVKFDAPTCVAAFGEFRPGDDLSMPWLFWNDKIWYVVKGELELEWSSPPRFNDLHQRIIRPGDVDQSTAGCQDQDWGAWQRARALFVGHHASTAAWLDRDKLCDSALHTSPRRLRLGECPDKWRRTGDETANLFRTRTSPELRHLCCRKHPRRTATSDGAPVPGFSIADCHEVFGDTVDRAVTWKPAAMSAGWPESRSGRTSN